MKFSMTAVLALAAAAVAVPNPVPGRAPGTCKQIVCTNGDLVVVDLDLDVNVLGLIRLDLYVDVLLKTHRECKVAWCCPGKCAAGTHVPDTCSRY
ncbi:hypothetical protein E4U54_006416 [Claviceps lovelessii]|nr:hypothetical protein E4U54_006416 [Claviceps lovelessii]